MRRYALQMPSYDISLAATSPFFQIAAPATTPLELIGFYLTNDASETSQQEGLTLSRRSTASTLYAGITARALIEGDPATLLAATTTTNAYGTPSATGTLTAAITRLSFNALPGLFWFPPPDARFTIKPSGFLTFEAVTTFASASYSMTAIVKELC